MQLMLNQIDDHAAIQLLLKDLVDSNKEVRYDLILGQIVDKIEIKWLDFAHKNKLWQRPVKCIAKFHLNDEHGFEQPGSGFELSAQIEPIQTFTLDAYAAYIRQALEPMRTELLKYDLDKVVFDVVDSQEVIDVFEYHDITKGF